MNSPSLDFDIIAGTLLFSHFVFFCIIFQMIQGMTLPKIEEEIESDIKSLDEPSESVESESSIVQNEQDKVEDDKQDIQNSNIDEVDDVDKSSNEEIDTQNVDREYVEKAIKSGELKPLYDEWKESDGIKYNLYITSTKESEDSNGFTPPLVPSVSTVEVNGNPVTVILPNDAKGYVATQGEDESVEYQPIDTTNNLMAPPTIGE
jgi:hypothetical protein